MIKEALKLNLGARTTVIPGFKNVDKDQHNGTVDIVSDVSKLDVKSNTVEEIYASHILEHFPHIQTKEVLAEWYRVLQPGGELKVAVPDFEMTTRVIYHNGGLNDWAVNYLWGDQVYDSAFHYAGFDEKRLTKLLEDVGFVGVDRVESFGLVEGDCSNLGFDSPDGRVSVSLNMTAFKPSKDIQNNIDAI